MVGVGLSGLVDPIARRLLELQLVSGTQWLLRTLGIVAIGAAVVLTLPGGAFANAGASLLTAVVGVGVFAQSLWPDTDVGLIAPLALVLVLAGQSDLTWLRAAAVGLALLVAHMSWALAATIPVHGTFSAAAWSLAGRGALMALAASLIGAVVVISLAGIHLGPWMVVAGVLAVIALFATVLPPQR